MDQNLDLISHFQLSDFRRCSGLGYVSLVSGARACNESTIEEVCWNPLFILQDQHHIGILVRALHFVLTSYGLQTHSSSGAKRTNFIKQIVSNLEAE